MANDLVTTDNNMEFYTSVYSNIVFVKETKAYWYTFYMLTHLSALLA